MQPDELHRRRATGVIDRSERVTVGEIETELRVVLAGGDELVGVSVHAWGDAQHHPRRRTDAGSAEHVEAVEFVEGVDHDVADLGLDRLMEFVTRPAVAVHRACVRRHPAANATCSSPPVATSSSSPSSYARRAIARHRKALVA